MKLIGIERSERSTSLKHQSMHEITFDAAVDIGEPRYDTQSSRGRIP